MAGYFSNNGEGTDANAARQFEREFADNPRSFGGPGGGFLGRLMGARQPSNGITSEPLPDRTPPQEAPEPPRPQASPQGMSLSSTAGLINRIITQSSLPPPPPVTSQEFMAGMPGPPPPQWSQGAPPPQGGPPMPPGPPPMPPGITQGPPPPQGPPQFGGNQFGGNQFGGNQFGGNQFGPSAPPPPPPPMPQPRPRTSGAGLPPYPQQPGAGVPAGGLTPQMAMDLVNYIKQQQQSGGGPRAFANGGYLRMMRGGYPADLMMGMPMRHDYARGSYVSEDGQGDGRSDHVDAKLSPGEFVVDAESVSMLGNGSNEAGARKLEQMRSGIRRQKGKALAKGKFSPDAKSPEAYMRGKTRGKS